MPTYIDPQGLGLVSRLELVAKQAVEGFLSGLHPSPYYGSSVEYADHRPYTMGDEIRTIDWKLWAKTDKYYVKLFEEQTNCRAMILLDASRSMAFQSEKFPTKWDYACYSAAALAYLLLGQNDAVGLAVLGDTVRDYLPPRSTATHFKTMLSFMERTQPTGESNLGPLLHEVAGQMKSRGIVVLISDLIDDLDGIADGLGHFRYRNNEVIVFQVMDPAELSFPFDRLTRFKDMEGAGNLVANPQNVRKEYLQRLDKFLNSVRGACHERGVSHELARTDEPYARMLSAFLEKRSKAKR